MARAGPLGLAALPLALGCVTVPDANPDDTGERVVLSQPVLVTAKAITKARATIEHTSYFGAGSYANEQGEAMRLLLTLDGAEPYFATLTAVGDGAQALYGLCGLYMTGSPRYEAERARLAKDTTPVHTRFGCQGMQDPVAFVVTGVWGGSFEDFCTITVAW